MLYYKGLTVILVINHSEMPIISEVNYRGDNEVIANCSHIFTSETKWNISYTWKDEPNSTITTIDTPHVIRKSSMAQLNLNGTIVGYLDWKLNEEFPSLSGSFKGSNDKACFRLSILRNPKSLRSIEDDGEVILDAINFEITVNQQTQKLFTNPNSYYDNERVSRALRSPTTLPSSRYHPYSKGQAQASLNHNPYLPAISNSPVQLVPNGSFVPSPLAYSYVDLLEKFKKVEERNKELSARLEFVQGSVQFLEKSTDIIYHKLAPHELLDYLDYRLKYDILAPDMRLKVVLAMRETKEILAKIDQNNIDNQVNRMCELLRAKPFARDNDTTFTT